MSRERLHLEVYNSEMDLHAKSKNFLHNQLNKLVTIVAVSNKHTLENSSILIGSRL
jgi:hypothetical protein